MKTDCALEYLAKIATDVTAFSGETSTFLELRNDKNESFKLELREIEKERLYLQIKLSSELKLNIFPEIKSLEVFPLNDFQTSLYNICRKEIDCAILKTYDGLRKDSVGNCLQFSIFVLRSGLVEAIVSGANKISKSVDFLQAERFLRPLFMAVLSDPVCCSFAALIAEEFEKEIARFLTFDNFLRSLQAADNPETITRRAKRLMQATLEENKKGKLFEEHRSVETHLRDFLSDFNVSKISVTKFIRNLIANLKINFNKIPSELASLLCIIHKHQSSILSLYFFEHFIWPYMFCLGGLKNVTFFFSNFNFIRKIFDSLMESMNEILGSLIEGIKSKFVFNEYCVVEAKAFLSILNNGVSKTSEGSKVKELINSINREFKIPNNQHHVRFFELQTKQFPNVSSEDENLSLIETEVLNQIKHLDFTTKSVSDIISPHFPHFYSSRVTWVSLVELLTRNDEFTMLRTLMLKLSQKLKQKAEKTKEAFLEIKRFVETSRNSYSIVSNIISKLIKEIKVSAKISKKCKGLITFDGSNLSSAMMNSFSNVINTKKIIIESQACFKIPCAKNYFGVIIRDAMLGLKLQSSTRSFDLEVPHTILKVGDMSAIVN